MLKMFKHFVYIRPKDEYGEPDTNEDNHTVLDNTPPLTAHNVRSGHRL